MAHVKESRQNNCHWICCSSIRQSFKVKFLTVTFLCTSGRTYGGVQNRRKNKDITVYTDTQYTFSTLHVFAQQWKNRGMVTSTGKPITHKDLILQLLDAIQLPRKVTICKCAAHISGKDFISIGNQKADEEAKRAAASLIKVDDIYTTEVMPTHIDHDILRDMHNSSPETEKNMWRTKGATQTEAGIWKSLDNKPILPNVARWENEAVNIYATRWHCFSLGNHLCALCSGKRSGREPGNEIHIVSPRRALER